MATGQVAVDPVFGGVDRVPIQGLKFIGVINPVLFEQNLPLESTQNGNIFTDRYNPQLNWYLPGYQLAPDIDAGFSFAAGAKGIDSDGNPYYQATVTLTLNKVEPPDVTAFRAANPAQIPLDGLTVTLTITSNDPHSGQLQQSVYTAAIAADAKGNRTLTFSALLGAQVLVAYSNLENGGATLALTAQYQVWREGTVFRPPIWHPPIGVIGEPPIDRPPIQRPPIGIGRPRSCPRSAQSPSAQSSLAAPSSPSGPYPSRRIPTRPLLSPPTSRQRITSA